MFTGFGALARRWQMEVDLDLARRRARAATQQAAKEERMHPLEKALVAKRAAVDLARQYHIAREESWTRGTRDLAADLRDLEYLMSTEAEGPAMVSARSVALATTRNDQALVAGREAALLRHIAELRRAEEELEQAEQAWEQEQAWQKTWRKDGGYQFQTTGVPDIVVWMHDCGYRASGGSTEFAPEQCAGCQKCTPAWMALDALKPANGLCRPLPRGCVTSGSKWDVVSAYIATRSRNLPLERALEERRPVSMGCRVPKDDDCGLCAADAEKTHLKLPPPIPLTPSADQFHECRIQATMLCYHPDGDLLELRICDPTDACCPPVLRADALTGRFHPDPTGDDFRIYRDTLGVAAVLWRRRAPSFVEHPVDQVSLELFSPGTQESLWAMLYADPTEFASDDRALLQILLDRCDFYEKVLAGDVEDEEDDL